MDRQTKNFDALRLTAALLLIPFALVFVGIESWPVLRRAGRFGDLSYGIHFRTWPVEQVVVESGRLDERAIAQLMTPRRSSSSRWRMTSA